MTTHTDRPTRACTCRILDRVREIDGSTRCLNPDCPIHGWRETARLEGRNVELVALQRRLDETAAIRAGLGGRHA
jgi:hypothetical protein